MTDEPTSIEAATAMVGEVALLATAARGIWMEMPRSELERAMAEVVARLSLLSRNMTYSLEVMKQQCPPESRQTVH
ncbi:MAG: hypothetical protein HZC22_17050 [Rhodocyclales bacterium]|nr:hypothetical protein [Rhodocyclales bacterium]